MFILLIIYYILLVEIAVLFMSFLYPIQSQGASWSFSDYGCHVFRVAITPLVSLMAVLFFLFKLAKDYLTFGVDPFRFAAKQNELDRDCRKIRFYARRLIPLIGYYWGHRNEERSEKYAETNSLSCKQLQALALKRTEKTGREGGIYVPNQSGYSLKKGEKLAWMIRACSKDTAKIEAILQGVMQTPFKNAVLPHILNSLMQDPPENDQVMQVLQALKNQNFDLQKIQYSVNVLHKKELFRLWDILSSKQ